MIVRINELMDNYTSTKTFKGFPCAHRRYAHKGHCRFIHGYSREFTFWFECNRREEATGFVMDFGDLKDVKKWLDDKFDHTLLLDSDDPLLEVFRYLESQQACKLTIYDDVGMEGTAKYVYDHVSKMISTKTKGRVRLVKVEARENEKNSATYENVFCVSDNM